jgi:phosphoglycolate phosphatase-like HAD superfamily hydrolase
MKLAVFDIDGTLTLGDGLGTRCYFSAFDEVFGEGVADRRLETYAESTDCGIAREAALRALGREPRASELDRFKSTYFDRLESAIAARERAYRPIPGAERFLALLAAAPGWTVAVATGNWRRAAALKLGCAGIGMPRVAACSEDGQSRAGVLAAAVTAATGAAGVVAFDGIVYVGDQPWDLRAAREVGAGFLGIATDARARRLEEDGAVVVSCYAGAEALLATLERVLAPR